MFELAAGAASVCGCEATGAADVAGWGFFGGGGAGKNAWASHFAQLGAPNLGIGGDRTPHIVYRINDGALNGLDSSVRVAVLMIGTNDLGGKGSVEQTAAGVYSCLQAIEEKLPHSSILLIAILPRSQNPDDLRAAVATLAQRHLAPDGLVCFRHDAADSLELPSLRVADTRQYGSMTVELLSRP